MKRPLFTATAAALLATACVQAQNGPTTTFDGLAGSRTVDTDGNVEMNGAAITLNGRVGGYVEMNGAAVDVDAEIGGSLEANGGAVSLTGRFNGDVEVNGGAVDLDGTFAEGFRVNAGALEFEGEATGPVAIAGSGRNRSWFGRERADRSEVEINGVLAEGGRICAHEVTFGSNASLGAPLTVIADDAPRYRDGFDSSLIAYQPRNGERCDEV